MKQYLIYVLCLCTVFSVTTQELRELDIDLNNYEYPYNVNFLELNIQNSTYSMAYMHIEAENPNGETVVLLHGKNFNGAYWQTTIDTLQKSGFNALVPDQAGFGKPMK